MAKRKRVSAHQLRKPGRWFHACGKPPPLHHLMELASKPLAPLPSRCKVAKNNAKAVVECSPLDLENRETETPVQALGATKTA